MTRVRFKVASDAQGPRVGALTASSDQSRHAQRNASGSQQRLVVTLLTGGQDPHYTFGLATALVTTGVTLDIIGSDAVDCPTFHDNPWIRFYNLMGARSRGVSRATKVRRIGKYYLRLIAYACFAESRVFHILWNNRLEAFDRTALMLFYRLLGKSIVLTAHNVNIRKRDGNDSYLNRITLRAQYALSNNIFVHSESMKQELVRHFGVSPAAVSVITYGSNNAIPDTSLTPAAAKRRLGLDARARTILFFGAIAPYKGLDLLAEAFLMLLKVNPSFRLVIAGLPKGGCEGYLRGVLEALRGEIAAGTVLERIGYVSDDETEVYLKAADVLALPYRAIFQSGVLIMAASFGLPVVASDVGSFRADILDLQSGLICRPNDSHDLARVLDEYFDSDLYHHIDEHRARIREVARQKHSWGSVAAVTKAVYLNVLR